MNNKRIKGVVKTVTERGFGFIETDEADKDIFYHVNSLEGELAERKLRVGDVVTFVLEDTPKGLSAVDIKLIELGKDFYLDTFLTEDGFIKENLISNKGEYNVKQMADFLYKNELTNTQLRKFYDNLVKIKTEYQRLNLNNEKDGYLSTIQKLYTLLALVEYSKSDCGSAFVNIFRNRINIVTENENPKVFKHSFEAFYSHMQALVAYFKD